MTQRALLLKPGLGYLVVGHEAEVERRFEEKIAELRALGIEPVEVSPDQVAPPPRSAA